MGNEMTRLAEFWYQNVDVRVLFRFMTNPGNPAPAWDLKNLVAWQVAMDLAAAVHVATRAFPEDERYGLRMQLRRSAVSVPSNIAEGHGRTRSRDYSRFVLIARGSLKETETQILLASRFSYLTVEQTEELLGLLARVNKLLTGLQRRLRE